MNLCHRFLPVCLALRQPLTGYPVHTYFNFLGLGLVTQVLGYLPASLVAPTLLGQPVVTALLAGIPLGETLSPGQVLGGMAVLVGVYAVHRSRQDAPKG